MKAIFAMIAILFTFCLAMAQTVAPPETMDGLVQFLGKFIEAITTGNWQVAGGILIMAVMIGVRQYGVGKLGLDTKYLPYLSALIAALAFMGLGMMNGVPALDAAKAALVQSLIANGMWDTLGKNLAKLILGDKYQSNDKS